MYDAMFVTAAILCFYILLQWLASLLVDDASIVDRFWGGGFALVALVSFAYLDKGTPRASLLLAMATVWGLRLCAYLTWRNWGQGEDYRYRAMRTYHGDRFSFISLITVFLFQGVLTWFISLPLQIGISGRLAEPLNPLDYLGAGLWLVGLVFETAGDFQLARFKANPANAGKVMDRGLWRFTRHPNYFGDALVWWGIYLVAASAPNGVYTVLSPALMTFLLLRVSGVQLLEKRLVKTRPAYADYVARTNAFVPGPPKRIAR